MCAFMCLHRDQDTVCWCDPSASYVSVDLDDCSRLLDTIALCLAGNLLFFESSTSLEARIFRLFLVDAVKRDILSSHAEDGSSLLVMLETPEQVSEILKGFRYATHQ